MQVTRAGGGRHGGEAHNPVWREDMTAALLATTLVLGLFIDGWNHINLQDGALGGFFTVWHALLYTGFTLTTWWVMSRNSHLYKRGVAPRPQFHRLFGIPLRYPFALAGIGIATVGMLGDVVWHTVFGDENGVARVIAPFHLALFIGATLLIAAPLRSAWHAPAVYPAAPTRRQILPALLSLTLITATIAFMFQWLSAFIIWDPSLQLGHLPAELAGDERVRGTVEFAGVARVLMTDIVLLAPPLLALRRWRLPPGSVTFLFTTVAVLMSALTEFRHGLTVLAALAGGLTADILVTALQPTPQRRIAHRVVAGATAAVMWTVFFIVLAVAYDTRWPFDLWAGSVGLSSLLAVVLSYLTIPASSLPGEPTAAPT